MARKDRQPDAEQAQALLTDAAGALAGILDALLEGASVRYSIGDEGVRLCRRRVAEARALIRRSWKLKPGKTHGR